MGAGENGKWERGVGYCWVLGSAPEPIKPHSRHLYETRRRLLRPPVQHRFGRGSDQVRRGGWANWGRQQFAQDGSCSMRARISGKMSTGLGSLCFFFLFFFFFLVRSLLLLCQYCRRKRLEHRFSVASRHCFAGRLVQTSRAIFQNVTVKRRPDRGKEAALSMC